MRVIGTAGHVDHGKSALVEALTGIHPDRLKEEREREMTIDLGFAWFTLPGGEEIGIVDVPGHRDFIENMLAGVGGIDAVILVIAADEGVMPQTREHLAILDLLQVQSGVVVLTKIDLIDDEAWLDLVEADVRNVLVGTSLETANIYRVSSKTRAGIKELTLELEKLLSHRPSPSDLGKPRLPIDRIFTMAGFGTVVTGTLHNGSFIVGEEVEILPSGKRGRIRGLQTHQRKVETALPGSRTAINISGIDLSQITRGEVVVKPSTYQPSGMIDVSYKHLKDASRPLKHNQTMKLFIGASETSARVRLLGQESLTPGEEGWLQLETNQPVVAIRGDRYILRRPSPGETIGGGVVVDAFPKNRHKRFSIVLLEKLDALAKGMPEDVIEQVVLEMGAGVVKDITARSNLNQESTLQIISQLIDQGNLVKLEKQETNTASGLTHDDLISTPAYWESLLDRMIAEVSRYHRTNALKQGLPREELRSRVKLNPRLFNTAVNELLKRGVFEETGVFLKERSFKVQFSSQQQTVIDAFLSKIKNNPYLTPAVKECQNEVGEPLYNVLIDQGTLIQVSPEVVFLKDDYLRMVAEISDLIKAKGSITAAEVRDHFKTSRKYALALLEFTDSQGITIRRGDERQLKG
jgi:selenocysteine-specific elongation factor